MDTQVLVVGAGPTGLVLALWLARLGVRFRIIDKRGGPGEASRAMAVQARTLEFYEQLGFADKVIAGGLKMERLHLREGKKNVATVEIGDFGKGISPYPFVLSFPQDDHERLLVAELKNLGVEVEWNTELKTFVDTGSTIRAVLKKGEAAENCEAAYLCGCDGAHSTVREVLGLHFPGGTYEQLFFVADVEAEWDEANEDVNLCLAAEVFTAVFPIRRKGMYRLIGLVPPELSEREGLTFEDVQPSVERNVGLAVRKTNWFSKYRVHHRVTDRFGIGRAFISGDAAHIHSPAGGQGMNTGIGDATNLAWKVAAVVQGRAAESILETYESERIGFAHALVKTTDRLFQGVVGKGMGAALFRTFLLPHLVPFVMGLSAVRTAEFKLISQTRIHYPDSALSAGKAGHVHGGDRLPWAQNAANFDALKSLDWQLHVYGQANAEIQQLAARHGLVLASFPWHETCETAGLKQNTPYLVRPDGYVAVAADLSEMERVLTAFKITPRPLT